MFGIINTILSIVLVVCFFAIFGLKGIIAWILAIAFSMFGGGMAMRGLISKPKYMPAIKLGSILFAIGIAIFVWIGYSF